ncbi:MAG: PL29 family lyase N-terminal domain-containing protein [Bacteroidales bacterium]
MKRKFTFFGICVLICTLMISLGSCQKDYSEDIDDLQEQIDQIKADVAALNTAIAQGKIITQVSTVTGGYQITFSDNSTITLNHGQDGADGEDGATGADGFTPIIGVDADGYWTVITSEGGAAVRIKDVNDNDVKAVLNDEFGVTANGMLTIGGVETAVQIPVIVYNEETETLQITFKNEDGDFVTYNIPVAENAFKPTDLVSVLAPIGTTNVQITYGQVPTGVLSADELEWAGVEEGQKLTSSGKMPVILNPANVNVDGFSYFVIDQSGDEFALQPESISVGYTGNFNQFVLADGANGLYSLNFNPEIDALEDLNGVTTRELAVKFTKGDRDIISGYQYAIRVDEASPLAYQATAAGNVDPLVIYSVIGEEDDILPYYVLQSNPTESVVPNDFFKSEVLINDGGASYNEDRAELVTVAGTKFSTEATPEVIADLNETQLEYFFQTLDWSGTYKQNDVEVIFWSRLDDAVPAYESFTHVIDDVERTKEVSFESIAELLDELGKGDIMGANANNMKFEIYDEDDVLVPADEITYQFIDEDGDPVSTQGATLTNAEIQSIDGVSFIYNETKVMPGNYTAKLTFDDERIITGGYPTYDEFEVEMPFVVENPVLSIADLTAKKANLFNGQKLVIYGTGTGSILQTNTANFYYDLFNAYKNFGSDVTAPMAEDNEWMFVSPSANPASILIGANNARFTFDAVGNILDKAEPNTEYPIELHYIYFGNINNTDSLETIMVEARSEVYDGYAETGTAAVEITNGDVVTTVTLDATHYKVFDYLGNDLNIFDPTDTRIDEVTLAAPADQAHLLSITPSGSTWVIKGTNNVAVINPTTITIPLTLTVKDVLGLEKEYTINVTVTQP